METLTIEFDGTNVLHAKNIKLLMYTDEQGNTHVYKNVYEYKVDAYRGGGGEITMKGINIEYKGILKSVVCTK